MIFWLETSILFPFLSPFWIGRAKPISKGVSNRNSLVYGIRMVLWKFRPTIKICRIYPISATEPPDYNECPHVYQFFEIFYPFMVKFLCKKCNNLLDNYPLSIFWFQSYLPHPNAHFRPCFTLLWGLHLGITSLLFIKH